MVVLKTRNELEIMRVAGKISAKALRLAGEMVRPGISTAQINKEIHRFIRSQGATPSFLGYGGFPASVCISVNNAVIHGIPNGRPIKPGDIVSIDVGAKYKGYNADNAATFAAGEIPDKVRALMEATRQSLYKGIDAAVVGNRVGDIGHAVQSFIQPLGYGIVHEYVGHGVGKVMHEEPDIPNVAKPRTGPRLAAGMTLAIEPMINLGSGDVKTLSDGWTVLTSDGSLSAHYEHTVVVTENGPVILTVE